MIKEPMTRRRIERYNNLQGEIAMLEEAIYKAQVHGDEYVTDVVKNSQRPLVIKGYGSRAIPRLCEKKARYVAECDEVERYIESLEDSIMRQLLTRKFIEGRTLNETAELVGYSSTQAGRLIKSFFDKMTSNGTDGVE